MDFIDKLQALAAKIPALCPVLKTEEATKNALVMPFIAALGYDPFDPLEVTPELVADVGTKKGEKVDYAINKDGQTIMLFECKHCGADLSLNHASQLFRYFTVTDAKIGVLTNGIVYKFFTDLDAPNKMDTKPFLEVNMLELNEAVVAELKKLTKPAFNLNELMDTAEDLKNMREFKGLLADLLESPTDEFVRFLYTKVYGKSLSANKKEYYQNFVKRAFTSLISDQINTRLKTALGPDTVVPIAAPQPQPPVEPIPIEIESADSKAAVVTTEDEREGFFIVKAILRNHVAASRIVARDTQSYFGILLDDNNRKPLVRLHFNRGQKYIGVFDSERKEQRVAIQSLDDIYDLAGDMIKVLDFYLKEK